MATDSVTIMGIDRRTGSPQPPAHSTPATGERQLPALRFSLRHLFWLVAIVSVTLAALVTIRGPSYAQLAMLLAASVVALHVFSTALGTKLRDHADEQNTWQPSPATQNDLENASLAAATAPSLLHFRGGEKRRLPLAIATGALVGGLLGAIALAATIGERTSPTNIAVGAISTAVVGAWFAFLGFSFWSILRQSWLDALKNEL